LYNEQKRLLRDLLFWDFVSRNETFASLFWTTSKNILKLVINTIRIILFETENWQSFNHPPRNVPNNSLMKEKKYESAFCIGVGENIFAKL